MTERKRIRFKSAESLASFLRSPLLSVDEVLDLVEDVQDMAEEHLHGTCKRMKIRIRGLDDETFLAALEGAVSRPDAKARDRAAHKLMLACIYAKTPQSAHGYDWGSYTRDSLIIAFAQFVDADFTASGKKQSADQRARRKDRPGSTDKKDIHGDDRNTRLRRFYARLVADQRHDATDETAREFDLSTRQVQRIVKAQP